MDATFEIQLLKDRCTMLESECNLPLTLVKKIVTQSSSEPQLDPKESLFLIGGSDGDSELASMDLYCPSKNVIKTRTPTSAACSYISAVHLNDQLYAFGGGNGHIWYDKVESYNKILVKWTFFSSLSRKKGSLAGVSMINKIFEVGSGKGTFCFSDVEILDFDIGCSISTRSMRFVLAAMELNGVLYASSGNNGIDYFKSAEIFDPREHSWTKISNMNTKRGCHPMIVLNDKLYVL
ncbi:putative kelch-type beta propeller [Lupinus albus]|uniref:Putative kelch-type beta propeller n=1 Tax=Lupinus albus TaxID=3870 RepID=A0A6A4QB07_LUPAL|nr:putative kelch-type beta propeller [Lupinus albus]